MKIKKSFEQAVCVLVMLALEKDDRPVKSAIISKKLGVSDSYLKKIMGKMRRKGLVDSDASKDGGFKLARPIHLMTMLDVYKAIEGDEHFLEIDHLGKKIFDEDFKAVYAAKDERLSGRPLETKIFDAEVNVLQVIYDAEQTFFNQLADYPLSNIFKGIDYQSGLVEWERVVKSNQLG